MIQAEGMIHQTINLLFLLAVRESITFYGSAQTTSSSDFDDYQVKIYVNGSNYAQARVRHHYAECINVVTQANLSVSDYVELYVYSGSAVDIFGADECSFFGAYKIIGA